MPTAQECEYLGASHISCGSTEALASIRFGPLFWNNANYLLVTVYYSRFPVVRKLPTVTTSHPPLLLTSSLSLRSMESQVSWYSTMVPSIHHLLSKSSAVLMVLRMLQERVLFAMATSDLVTTTSSLKCKSEVKIRKVVIPPVVFQPAQILWFQVWRSLLILRLLLCFVCPVGERTSPRDWSCESCWETDWDTLFARYIYRHIHTDVKYILLNLFVIDI